VDLQVTRAAHCRYTWLSLRAIVIDNMQRQNNNSSGSLVFGGRYKELKNVV
jgi:hypothetical protein